MINRIVGFLFGAVLALLISAIVVTLVSSRAHAAEIHTILTENCSAKSGLIVNVTEDSVSLLTLEGESTSVKRDKIQSIFVASTLENPVRQVRFDQTLLNSVKRVTVKGDEFVGWPVRFVEQLVMFYDLNGKTRVYEKKKLLKLRPIETAPAAPTNQFQKVAVDWSGLSAQCDLDKGSLSAATVAGGALLQPIRTLEDQIKVSQYLDDLQGGYRDLDSYQERTYLYARPILYNTSSRLGFYLPHGAVERNFEGIFSFRWGGGDPYHFQSFNHLGQQRLEFSPYALPTFALRNDLKAHVFHTHLSGDVRGLPGGSRVYKEIGYKSDSKDKFGGDTEVQTGINYVLLMGGDFGPASGSIGYYYPSHFFRVGDQLREVMANRQSYAFRVMWTTARFRLHGITSTYQFDSTAATDKDIYNSEYDYYSPLSATNYMITRYNFKGKFLRGGIDWDISATNRASLDVVTTDGEYSGIRTTGTVEGFSFTKRSIIAAIYQDFGDYVGLGVTGTWVLTNMEHSGFLLPAGQRTTDEFLIGGEVEFIF